MSREIKLGLLTIVTLVAIFIALNFIKGSNVFSESLTVYTKFDNVAGLDISSPVYINGFKVGAVQNISINPEKLTQMIVELRIEGDYKLPKSTKIIFRSDGMVAGNALDLKFIKQCSGKNCVVTGDYLTSEKIGLLSSMFSDEEIDEVSDKIGSTAQDVIAAVGDESSTAPIDVSARELESTLANMTKLTDATNRLIRNSSQSIQATMSNMEKITANIDQQNGKISSMLTNMEKLSKELTELKLANISANANKTMVTAEKSMADVSKTLASAEETVKELNNTLKKLNSGDGSLAKLMNDPELYSNLEGTSRNLSLLLQDVRLNPKRYIKLSVFGKKQQQYVVPEDDPADLVPNN